MATNDSPLSVAASRGLSLALGSEVGPNPSGGVAAFSWEGVDGNINHGSTLRVKTDGTYNFGAKSQAAPALWDFGSELYENGVAKTHASQSDGAPVQENDAYESINGQPLHRSTRPQRTSRVDFHYYFDFSGNNTERTATLNKPRAFSPDTIDSSLNHEVYFARRIKLSKSHDVEQVERLYAPAWQPSTAYAEGDRISFLGVQNGGAQSGDGSDLMFEAQNSGTSGASEPAWPDENTVNVGTDTFTDNDITWLVIGRSSSSTKFGRVWDTSSGSGTRVSWTHLQLTGPFTSQSAALEIDSSWHLFEMFVSNRLGVARTYVDGQPLHDAADFVQADTNYKLWPTSIGFEQNGIGPTLLEVDWGEHYADTTAQRVVFGNASQWPSVTEVIFNRTTAWGEGEIDVVINDDGNTLSGNWWIYVIDSDNAPINSDGVAL